MNFWEWLHERCMYVRPASRILTVCGMRHDLKILTNISYSLSQVQHGSKELENSRVCTSSSKLRREVMKHTYAGRGKFVY